MKLLTVKEAALQLGVSAATVYGLCRQGRLRHTRIGLKRGVIRISDDALKEYLSEVQSNMKPVLTLLRFTTPSLRKKSA